MSAHILPHMKPSDPREQDVRPEPEQDETDALFSVRPGRVNFAGIIAEVPPLDTASVLRAKRAQQAERDGAIRDTYDEAASDLFANSAMDSLAAKRIAPVFAEVYRDEQDRRDAAVIALRVFNPEWRQVSRYHSAERICGALRLWLCDKLGTQVVSEDDLRAMADRLSGIAHEERMRTWLSDRATTPKTWAAARLGFLNFADE